MCSGVSSTSASMLPPPSRSGHSDVFPSNLLALPLRSAINNRTRLRPQLPAEYFGNTIYAISTEAVTAGGLLARGHGWATAAVGRAVVVHTDADIRARVAAWMAKPVVYTLRYFDPNGVTMGSSPRFDMYGCDFGWGRSWAAGDGQEQKLAWAASDGQEQQLAWAAGDGQEQQPADLVLVLAPRRTRIVLA